MTWKKLKHICKLSKFWHQLSSFITTLWDGVNYKFIQLVDLKNLCGCIPGYQTRKVYRQGQLKLTHTNFVTLNMRFVKIQKHLLIFRQLKTKNLDTAVLTFFKQENLLYIKWYLSENLIATFQSLFNAITCWQSSRQFY